MGVREKKGLRPAPEALLRTQTLLRLTIRVRAVKDFLGIRDGVIEKLPAALAGVLHELVQFGGRFADMAAGFGDGLHGFGHARLCERDC